jgi:hypothetical protein
MIERLVHVSHSHREAHEWDVEQQIRMTPEQRQRIARELRRRVYGANRPDVRAAYRKK